MTKRRHKTPFCGGHFNFFGINVSAEVYHSGYARLVKVKGCYYGVSSSGVVFCRFHSEADAHAWMKKLESWRKSRFHKRFQEDASQRSHHKLTSKRSNVEPKNSTTQLSPIAKPLYFGYIQRYGASPSFTLSEMDEFAKRFIAPASLPLLEKEYGRETIALNHDDVWIQQILHSPIWGRELHEFYAELKKHLSQAAGNVRTQTPFEHRAVGGPKPH